MVAKMKSTSTSTFILICVGLVGALTAFFVFSNFSVIRFQNLNATALPEVFFGLIFVALVIERAIQVYTNVFEPTEDPTGEIALLRQAEVEVKQTQAAVTAIGLATRTAVSLGPSVMADAASELKLAHENHRVVLKQVLPVKQVLEEKRRQKTTALGMALGVLAALVGVRALGPFIEVGEFQGTQGQWFAGVDVLITGALLAGGADGLHTIVEKMLDYFKGP